MPNFPPGIPQQSMPAGWLRKISWCEEQIKLLSKQIVTLEKRVKELECERMQDKIVDVLQEQIQAAAKAKDDALTEDIEKSLSAPLVKRGPGRPRKNPIEPQQ